MFNPLEHPLCFAPLERLAPSTWIGHTPFATYLTEILKPRVLVELGTYYGTSFCAFCQAVKSLEIETKCYAVDTWRGDPQSGFFGGEVYEDLKAYHDKTYGEFSRLIPSTFDEALKYFDDATLDLLHIDGFHTYEAVKNDFEKWLPKMSERGVILFHDTNVKEKDFGVWRFWSEVKTQYPNFEFLHSHGLGLLAVGAKTPPAFNDFLKYANHQTTLVRSFFYQLGTRFESALQIADLKKALEAQPEANRQMQIKEQEFEARQKNLEAEQSRLQAIEGELDKDRERLRKLEEDFKIGLISEEKKLKRQYRKKEEVLQKEINELEIAQAKLAVGEDLLNQRVEQLKTEQQQIFTLKGQLRQALLEVNNGEFGASQLFEGIERKFDLSKAEVKKQKLVIGIVTYNNSPQQIEHLSKSIITAIGNAAQDDTCFEVFVIDNGGETCWEKTKLPLTKFESFGNVGFGSAMNHLMTVAFADSATEWFLCLNPDGALHHNALRELLESARSNPNSLIEALQFPEEHPKKYDARTFEISWASGACLLISRAVYEKTAGFDPNFFMYMEDVDLSWRARAYGFKVLVAPKALFAHSVLDRGFDENTDRYCLISGRYLAYKWKDEEFLKWTEKELVGRKYFSSAQDLPKLPELNGSGKIKKDVSTFEFYFHFAPARW